MRRIVDRYRRRARHSRTGGAVQPFDSLESRLLLAANPLAAIKQAQAASHLDPQLSALHSAFLAGQDVNQLAATNSLSLDAAGRVSVTVRARNVNAVSYTHLTLPTILRV